MSQSTSTHHGGTLASGALVNTLAFLSSNLRAIFTFLIARLLGGPALGTFGVAWAIADLASKFGTLGLDYNVMAFVARSEANGDRTGSRRIWRTAVSLSLSAAVLVALIGSLIAALSPGWWGVRPALATAATWMLWAVPGITLYRVCNGLSRGMKVMQHDVYSRGLTESLGTAAALLIAIALGARELAPMIAAIAGTGASGLVAFALARRLYRPIAQSENGAALDATRMRGHVAEENVTAAADAGLIRTSLPIALYDLLNIGIMRVDVIMLGLFVNRAPGVTLETVGIYAACVEVAGGLRKLSQAFTPILTPVLAEQIALGRLRDAESSYGYVARWMLAVLLPAVAVLALAGGALLSIFGAAFHAGGAWVAVAGAACALNAFVGLGETILMIQRPAWNVINTSVAFVVAIGLNLLLIPRFGPLGAAFGMLGPYVIQGLLRGFEITRLLGWHWPWRALLRPWLAALAALPLALVVRLWLLDGSWAELAAAVVYVTGYLAVWWRIGLEAEDQLVIRRLRGQGA